MKRRNKKDRINKTGMTGNHAHRSVLTALRAVLLSSVFFCLFSFRSFAGTEKQQLDPPVFKENSGYTVRWEEVKHAGAYEVRLSIETERKEEPELKVFTVGSTSAGLADYAAAGRITCQVRSLPDSKDRSYRESEWTLLDEQLRPAEDNTAAGYFHRTNGHVTFTCIDGKSGQGWQKLNGCWYYFDPDNHNEAARGWKDAGSVRYFFDSSCHMLTGWKEISGAKYYFSETVGSDLGKMLTGLQEITPGSFYYFRTDEDAAEDGSFPAGSLDEEKTKELDPEIRLPYAAPVSAGTGTSGASDGKSVPSGTEALTENSAGAGIVIGWVTNPDGTWSYLTENGVKLKNCWHEEGGCRYYFGSEGVMLTGWQYVDGIRKYFAIKSDPSGMPEGACVEDAEDTEEAGKLPESSSTQKTENKMSAYTIRQCSITVQVKEAEQGTVRKAELTDATSSEIISVTYSVPCEDQKPGMRVTMTAVLNAKDGFGYSSSCVYSCRNARIISNTGNSTVRTVCLEYTAQTKLSSPEVFYSNEEYILRWMKPSNAARFRVTVNNGFERRYTFYTKEPVIDLTEYGDPQEEEKTMSVEIASMGEENTYGYLDSEKNVISNAFQYTEDHTVKGGFEIKGNELRFLTDSGEYLKGWQEILGERYHFRNTGYAEPQGWYQDTDGSWYYFDEYHRMKRGRISLDGKEYFLNDGSNTGCPPGALVE